MVIRKNYAIDVKRKLTYFISGNNKTWTNIKAGPITIFTDHIQAHELGDFNINISRVRRRGLWSTLYAVLIAQLDNVVREHGYFLYRGSLNIDTRF